MGDDTETVCGYCSTLFRYDPTLGTFQSDPAGARWGAPETMV